MQKASLATKFFSQTLQKSRKNVCFESENVKKKIFLYQPQV
jgi:hypothetical protein